MLSYIFSANFLDALLRMGTPLVFVGMAAVMGGKANILCVAYEGMMLFAALGGAIGSAYTQSLLAGAALGMAFSMAVAMIFAYFVLYLDTKPLLAGLALNTLGTGGTVYVVYLLTGMKLDTSSLPSLKFPAVDIPLIKDIPILGPILSGHNLMTYLAFFAVALVWFLLKKTRLGLRIQAVGQDAAAAASVGINVRKTKFIALTISSIFAAMGGMYMSMGYLPYFTANMTAGRGFIGIAAQNLAVGHPLWTMFFALLFGASMAVGNMAQSYRLPSQFAALMPYLITLIGIVIMGARSKKQDSLTAEAAMKLHTPAGAK